MRSTSEGAPFDRSTAEFLDGGRALIMGTVSRDGQPRAMRCWGATVLAGGPALRVVIDAAEAASIEHCAAGGPIALTATDVPTLRSLQLKGRAAGVEPATEADRVRAERYCKDFFDDIQATDGTARTLLERLVPPDYAVVVVTIEELFDQTPGPDAGAPLRSGWA